MAKKKGAPVVRIVTAYEKARIALSELYGMACVMDKGRADVVCTTVEVEYTKIAKQLNAMRKYFIDHADLGGEESPFVKTIDLLLPRP